MSENKMFDIIDLIKKILLVKKIYEKYRKFSIK